MCINSNPDVSGIGVRVAIYIQNFLSFIPAASALWDGRVTFSELDSLERQSTSILITALSILISTIIQAHRDNGITNFHASIVLNLSWMNNTNLFIYLLLYVFRRSHLDKEKRAEEDKSLDDLEWAPHRRTLISQIRKKFFNAAVKPRQTNTSANKKASCTTAMLCNEIKEVCMNLVVIIGSLHLSFMAAIGIWLWSNPAAFGTSKTCTLSMSTFIFGAEILLGSKELRIWSIVVYSVLVIPLLNLIVPGAFFAIFFLDNQGRLKFTIGRRQVLTGLIVLAIIEAIFLIDTEVMLARNSSQVETGETEWTFGQTLAVLVLLVPLRDLIEAVLEEGVQKQRRRLLLNAAHGIKGMVEVLLDFGVKKKDLNTLFRGACAQGHVKIARLLLKKIQDQEEDMDIWEKDKNGRTALHHAARSMKARIFWIVNILMERTIDHGKLLNIRDKTGRTALHYAAEAGGAEIVKMLTGHKEDLNVEDKRGRAFLHCAAEARKAETEKTSMQADLNVENQKCRTARHCGKADIVRLLMEHQADPNITDNEGHTALDLAKLHSDK